MSRTLVTLVLIAIASVCSGQIHWTGTSRCNDLTYLYMAPTGDAYCLSHSLGIMKSTNKGQTWRPVYGGAEIARMNRITWTTQGFFAVTGGHIYRSTDNGENWTDLPVFNKHNVITETPDHALLLGTSSGVKRSVDSGATWIDVGTNTITSWVEDIVFTPEGIGYAISSKLHRTTDGGLTWDSVYNFGGNTYRRIAIDAQGRIYLGGFNLIRSDDIGKTWTELKFADISKPPQVMSIDLLHGMIFISSAKSFQSTTGPGLFYSSDDGLTWKLDLEFADESIVGVVSDSDGILYAGSYAGGDIYRSTTSLLDVGDDTKFQNNPVSMVVHRSEMQKLSDRNIHSLIDMTGREIRFEGSTSVQPGIYFARSAGNVLKVLLLP